ncbi:hypothetical protein BDZ91DRAFT_751780, partial [Kalaharituber pfeilii]
MPGDPLPPAYLLVSVRNGPFTSWPLSQSYCSALSHLPPSLTLLLLDASSRYTTTELVFFPSSSKLSFFFSHRIPVILPRS